MTHQERQIKIREKELIEEINFKIYADLNKNISKYKFSPTSASYDGSMLSGTNYIIFESKTRKDVNNALVLKNGPFLELKKITGMQEARDKILAQHGIEPLMFYINYVSDATQIYRLKEKHHYTYFWKELPKDNITPWILEWKMVAKLFDPEEIIFHK